MNSARHPQVPNPTGDTQFNVKDAALRGASSAFAKPPVKPKPANNTYTGGNNGALLAATKADAGSPRTNTPRPPSPVKHNGTGGSSRSLARPTLSPMQLLSKSNSSSTLGVPDVDRAPSPSNIAAKLAAARYSPMKLPSYSSPVPAVNERDRAERETLSPVGHSSARLDSRRSVQQPRPRPSRGNTNNTLLTMSAARDHTIDNKTTDDTPIPPTTTLVHLFEQNRPTASLKISQAAPPPVRSPKPQRTFHIPPEPKDAEMKETEPLERKRTRTPPPVKPKPQVDLPAAAMDGPGEHLGFSMLRKDTLGTPPTREKPAQLAAIKTSVLRPKPPSQRHSRPRSEELARPTSIRSRVSTSIDSNENASSPSSFVSAYEQQEQERLRPALPPPRRSGKARNEALRAETRPNTSYTPDPRGSSQITSPVLPPVQLPRRRSASAIGLSPPANTLYHSNYQRESVKAITKHMTGESLSNAIMGAALASSRNASPAPPMTANPPLPARRYQHHHSPFHPTRSPSPTKPSGKLRATMRKEKSSSSSLDESEKYKKKGTRVMGMRRKHPNKHHEGTRKRWRDAITERERKRYEGVWAANKGLYVTPPTHTSRGEEDASLDVSNVVIKELWTRSRLPEHELEEVWSLVDGRDIGRLRREEFVVGMWLIDQRLKGRKLPIRVSESVWESVKGVGVRVKLHPK